MVLQELIFQFLQFLLLGGCGGLGTDLQQFLLWDGVVLLKELIFNSFYFGRCGVLERTDFSQFLLLGVWWS